MSPKIKRLDNGIFVMIDDSHLSRWVERDGRLDNAHQYLAKFQYLVPEGGTVVDCGTCIGDHTVTYASWVGPKGTVVGFEAHPDVAECCALNLGIYPWARVHNVGLSNTNGVSGILQEANIGASFISEEVSDRVLHVKLAPLDDYINEVSRCDLIKVDIEGFEVRFLDGAQKFLKKYKPAILMEINRHHLHKHGAAIADVFYRLDNLNYKWSIVDGTSDSDQYDILAVQRKRP